jgi:hypothetical protein
MRRHLDSSRWVAGDSLNQKQAKQTVTAVCLDILREAKRSERSIPQPSPIPARGEANGCPKSMGSLPMASNAKVWIDE